MLGRIVGSFSREFHPFHRETGKLIDRLFASIFLSSPLILFVLREDNFVGRPAPVCATTYERFELVSFVFRTLSNRRVKYEGKERRVGEEGGGGRESFYKTFPWQANESTFASGRAKRREKS